MLLSNQLQMNLVFAMFSFQVVNGKIFHCSTSYYWYYLKWLRILEHLTDKRIALLVEKFSFLLCSKKGRTLHLWEAFPLRCWGFLENILVCEFYLLINYWEPELAWYVSTSSLNLKIWVEIIFIDMGIFLNNPFVCLLFFLSGYHHHPKALWQTSAITCGTEFPSTVLHFSYFRNKIEELTNYSKSPCN